MCTVVFTFLRICVAGARDSIGGSIFWGPGGSCHVISFCSCRVQLLVLVIDGCVFLILLLCGCGILCIVQHHQPRQGKPCFMRTLRCSNVWIHIACGNSFPAQPPWRIVPAGNSIDRDDYPSHRVVVNDPILVIDLNVHVGRLVEIDDRKLKGLVPGWRQCFWHHLCLKILVETTELRVRIRCTAVVQCR